MPQTPSSLVHRPLLEQISTVVGILSLSILVAWIVAQATLMAYRLYREPIEVPCSVQQETTRVYVLPGYMLSPASENQAVIE